MITFPAIWWLFPTASLVLISFSMYLARPGGLESAFLRKAFVAFGALLGFLALALPFFKQPLVCRPPLSITIGLPLTVIGLVGRVYPMLYLQRQGTSATLDRIERLVDTGPYQWVRHPQYTFGFILLVGWFIAWGALYSLAMLPLVAVMIYVQALIEERHLLEPRFGDAYVAYRKRTGMFAPRLSKTGISPKRP